MSDSGTYGISTDSGRLAFVVSSGGAFIQWIGKERRLVVLVGSQRIIVPGTELAVMAGTDGRALLYVREGVVRLLDAGDLPVAAGEMYELSNGAAPRQLDAGSGQLAQLAAADIGEHQSVFDDAARESAVRSRGIWHTPWPYVAVVLAGSATYCGAVSDTRCGTRKKRRTAVVVVHVPL
ncbi:MAG: hypothetical protein ACJ79K_09715 [Gemmatimonadaceae bacterium]